MHAAEWRRPSVGVGAGVVLLWLCAISCGGGGSIADPGPTPPSGTFVDIAGRWSGVLESANLPARQITMMVVQSGNCVDGVWEEPGGWTGAISGFATGDAYEGQISIERDEGGRRCSAVGVVTGPVATATAHWTGSGFSGVGAVPCQEPLPQSIVLTMRRE
ncbi:MAG: hypothetical protein AB7O32_02220 [Vicinamibacterales bacterium]